MLLAAGVASKWKHYRDVHYRLYEANKDIEGYEKSMKIHQTIIKNWMETYNEQLIEAVTNICKQEDDARYQLKFYVQVMSWLRVSITLAANGEALAMPPKIKLSRITNV